MSLDTVELIMAIEHEFGLEIPDSEAATLAVLGDMHDYLMSALRRRGDVPDENQVWERLKAVVIRQLGVCAKEVKRTAHIVYDLGAD